MYSTMTNETTYNIRMNNNKSNIQRPKHQPEPENLQAALKNLIPFLFCNGAPRGVSNTFENFGKDI